MRSSIACVRCRRSKVKCVNTGPNTTCRACESSNRECTYPQPVQGGTPRNVGAAMAIGSVSGSAAGGGGGDRSEAPKKAKPKKPSSNANAAPTAASMNTPLYWRECLGSSVLTQATWQLIFDAFQLHYSPVLPFLHPPTFLNRLRASAANPCPPSGNSPPPEKPHSPLALLGMLALTARHVPSLVGHYAPALATPTAVSEFYASALKYRLKNDDEESLLIPTLDKVQALSMLGVHEWGQMRKSDAYMWLGIAIRMSGALGLSWIDVEDAPSWTSYSPEPETETEIRLSKRRRIDNGAASKAATAFVVEKEIRRRTFWAVFILDKALSSGRYFPSGVSSRDADRVQLPCEERGFMFGAAARTEFLDSQSLLDPAKNGGSQEHSGGDKLLAHVVKAMELWGQVQLWTEATDGHPTSTSSAYHKLSTALDAFVDTLPHQLEFSPSTLQVHFSTRSSSTYAILHITLFLARITLERKFLPALPFLSPRPLGPEDPPREASAEEVSFFEASAEHLYASARDLITLVNSLDEWNARIESPFVISAVESAAQTGLYAFHFPWMDRRGYLTGVCIEPAESVALGNGEDTRRAVELISSLKPRWPIAEESCAKLLRMHSCLVAEREKFAVRDPARAERNSNTLPNTEEQGRLFGLLTPATPKQVSVATPLQGASAGSDVDTLLLAASGTTPESVASTTAAGRDRWMAVNTAPVASISQSVPRPPPPPPPSKSRDGGSLDALAGFAAQHEKIRNGEGRDVEMGEAGLGDGVDVVKQERRDARWIEGGGGGWGISVTEG